MKRKSVLLGAVVALGGVVLVCAFVIYPFASMGGNREFSTEQVIVPAHGDLLFEIEPREGRRDYEVRSDKLIDVHYLEEEAVNLYQTGQDYDAIERVEYTRSWIGFTQMGGTVDYALRLINNGDSAATVDVYLTFIPPPSFGGLPFACGLGLLIFVGGIVAVVVGLVRKTDGRPSESTIAGSQAGMVWEESDRQEEMVLIGHGATAPEAGFYEVTEEPLPPDIEELLDELEEEYGTEEPLPPKVEQLLQALQPPNLSRARRRAAKQLATASRSNWRVAHDLVVIGETDPSAEVRGIAAESLRAPVHQAVLQRYPALRDRAQVLAQHLEAAQEREQRRALADRTGTGQSRLAYRLAALVLFLAALFNIVDSLVVWAFGVSTELEICGAVPILIDLGLAIGLFQLRKGARTWVLVRAVLGATVWPIFLFISNDATTAIILSVIQWGFCGALILLLTGQSKTWRLVLAMGSFVIFALGLCGVTLLLVILASAQ